MSEDDDTPKRNIFFPTDFFARPSVIRLCAKHPRMVEWWLVLVLVAKETRDQGRLLAGGESLSLADLALLSRNSMTEEFLQDLLSEKLLSPDRNDSYRIARWSDYHKSSPEEREKERIRSQKRRDEARLLATEKDRARPETTTLDPGTRTRPVPGPYPGPAPTHPLPVPGRGEEPAPPEGEGADGRCAPPTRGDDLRPWTLGRFESLRGTRRLSSGERKRVAAWYHEAIRDFPAAVVRWAVEATVAHTLHTQRTTALDTPVGYALDKIEAHLDAALSQHNSNAIRAECGKAGADYVFRPPKPSQQAEGAA